MRQLRVCISRRQQLPRLLILWPGGRFRWLLRLALLLLLKRDLWQKVRPRVKRKLLLRLLLLLLVVVVVVSILPRLLERGLLWHLPWWHWP